MEQIEKILIMYPFPALLSPLSLISFTTEEITGYANQAAKVANRVTTNPPFCSFLFHL